MQITNCQINKESERQLINLYNVSLLYKRKLTFLSIYFSPCTKVKTNDVLQLHDKQSIKYE